MWHGEAGAAASANVSSRTGKVRRTQVPWPGRAFNFDGAFVALHHAINHRQSQAGAAACGFGGEKGFQAMLAGFFIHAHAVVPHFDLNLPFRRQRFLPGPGRMTERVTKVMVPPWGRASTALKIRLISASRSSVGSLNNGGRSGSNSRSMWMEMPSRCGRSRQRGRVSSMTSSMMLVEVHLGQLFGVGAAAVKLPHAGDDVGDVLAGLD